MTAPHQRSRLLLRQHARRSIPARPRGFRVVVLGVVIIALAVVPVFLWSSRSHGVAGDDSEQFLSSLTSSWLSREGIAEKTTKQQQQQQQQHDYPTDSPFPDAVPEISETKQPSKPPPPLPLPTADAAICPTFCQAPPKSVKIQMLAFPHTASSSTERLFKATSDLAWHSGLLPYDERGFSCPENMTIIEYKNCGTEEKNDTNVLACVLDSFHFAGKRHSNYNKVSSLVQKPFTILRKPELAVVSQSGMRRLWDILYGGIYPGSKAEDVEIEEWVEKAWWRHNLFTKMLATDSEVIWVSLASVNASSLSVVPSKEQSDRENSLGRESVWFQTALDRLKTMPLFGLHHRVMESFELMGFRMCFPVPQNDTPHRPREALKRLDAIVEKNFRLDSLLLQEAEKLFDEMISDMREKKAKGILCDLSHMLDKPGLEMGLQCTRRRFVGQDFVY